MAGTVVSVLSFDRPMVLSRLFRKKTSQPAIQPRVPDGQRVYAIGDIHGRADLFGDLLERISVDDAARGAAETSIVLLGDLVDRGPDSRGVVERAMRLRDEFPRVRWLIGNHEEVFLTALGGDPQHVRYFVRIGGAPTIHSYGLAGQAYDNATFEEVAERLPALVPADHVSFLAAGEDMIVIGDYLFVHAGIKPGIALNDQKVPDLRWIRADFLDDARHHGKMVVHGHTIVEEVEEYPNRIAIDTGAYASGRLTALGLEGAERWTLQTDGEPAR